MTYRLLTIREMCDLYDVSPRTLRFYESKELLFPKREGNQRLFTRSCRVRMKLIVQGKRFGFQLEEIRRLLALYDEANGKKTQFAETYRVATTHFEEMCARRMEMDAAIVDLEFEIKKLARRLEFADYSAQRESLQASA